MKIVINRCYGGFGLSDKAMYRYAELKGIKVYPERSKGAFEHTIFWVVPKEQRQRELGKNEWVSMTEAQQREYNRVYNDSHICDHNIPREDPALVQTVEELKEEANGSCAKLSVVEIPDDVEWEIDEYDGMESVEEAHRSWS